MSLCPVHPVIYVLRRDYCFNVSVSTINHSLPNVDVRVLQTCLVAGALFIEIHIPLRGSLQFFLIINWYASCGMHIVARWRAPLTQMLG